MTGYNPITEIVVMSIFMALLLIGCYFAIQYDRKKAAANKPRGATRI